MHAIDTEDLTKDYALGFWRKRPYRALDRLTLAVEPGSVFGLLGPNGAGKTTTLKLLLQLVFPTAGRAEILGRPAGDVSVRRRIGYLPENPYFYDHLTAVELLDYFGCLLGLDASQRAARIPRLLDQVGLGAERRLPLRRSRRACCSESASRRRSLASPRSSSSMSPPSLLPRTLLCLPQPGSRW